jgi:hypothetical protein
MASRRSSAKPVRFLCDKCGFPFTVVAYISKGADKDAWMREVGSSHDCDEAAKHRARSAGIERLGQQKQRGKK